VNENHVPPPLIVAGYLDPPISNVKALIPVPTPEVKFKSNLTGSARVKVPLEITVSVNHCPASTV
jgi:hypothetical protein